MKAIKILLTVLAASLFFTGCATSGNNIGMSSVTQKDVKHTFMKGVIKSSQKVLVSKSNLSTLGYATAGAVVGAGTGALITKDATGGIIGGLIGAGTGALFNMTQEVEAYQVEIMSFEQKKITTFLEIDLPIGSVVEFVEREDGKITNVNIIEVPLENNKKNKRSYKINKNKKYNRG